MSHPDVARKLAADIARYSPLSITLHWSVAALIVVVGVLGLLHDSWPKRTQAFWINIHAVAGLLFWLLVMLRVAWRFSHRPPALPPQAGDFARRSSPAVHALLYGLMLVIPMLGIVTFIWHARVFDFGLFRIDFGVASSRAIFHPTEDVHGYLACALFALAGLHALAACWHQFVRRDGLLLRMWPPRDPGA